MAGIIPSTKIPVNPNVPGPVTDHSTHTTAQLPTEPDMPYARDLYAKKPIRSGINSNVRPMS